MLRTTVLALSGAATCSWSLAQQDAASCAGPKCIASVDEVELLQVQRRKPVETEEESKEEIDAEAKIFWKEWEAGAMDKLRVEEYEKCYLSESDCSPESMKGKPTLVYTGGETKCLNGDDYAFAVFPRSSDKLLYYFEGGGACWEANGAYGKQTVWQCTDSMEYGTDTSGLNMGVQNMADKRNPFFGHTVVEPIYCSGDAFMGNTSMEWDGEPWYQTGYLNQRAVLDWTEKHFTQELRSLVVAGFSAGSLGTMAWAETVLSTFPHQHGAVLMDSYAGFFPPGTQGETIWRWGGCDFPLFDSFREKCKARVLTVEDMIMSAMEKFPDVTFASIESKVDDTQIFFYDGMAQSWGMVSEMGISGPSFYNGTNAIYETYVGKYKNWVGYLVDGEQHCFTNLPNFYTASTGGADVKAKRGQMMLYEWVQGLLDGEGSRYLPPARGPATTQCLGAVMSNGANTVDYCDADLMSA